MMIGSQTTPTSMYGSDTITHSSIDHWATSNSIYIKQYWYSRGQPSDRGRLKNRTVITLVEIITTASFFLHVTSIFRNLLFLLLSVNLLNSALFLLSAVNSALSVLTLQWFGGRGAMVLTALAGEWQEHVARHVSDAVVSQCRARVITLSVWVDPRAPVDVVVVLELCHQLTQLTLIALRVARPCQDRTVVLHRQTDSVAQNNKGPLTTIR